MDDRGFVCETRDKIKERIDKLSKYYVIKDLGKMDTFVGYKIINNNTVDTV
jgi:hypothetical protein